MVDNANKPKVTIAGAGVAGLTAAHRLLERGFNVTLLEANAFIGGKLGAHQDKGDGRPKQACEACRDNGGCLRPNDWHEHCYHMYLNWYHNFWYLMEEIGSLQHFIPMPDFFNIRRHQPGAGPQPAVPIRNVGSPWTAMRNIFSGYGSPADMFLWYQTMADLVGQPARRNDWLERTSITSFMRSRGYVTERALAGTYRTTAQAFASPSYLSSARSFKTLLSNGLRLPEPSMWLLTGSTEEAIFRPWRAHLDLLASRSQVSFTPSTLTSLLGLHLDGTGRIGQVTTGKNAASPTVHRGTSCVMEGTQQTQDLDGDLILALPLSELSRLVTPQVAACAPSLPEARNLRTEPMISIDLYFRRKLRELPKGVTLLLDSPYEMSFLDISQTWRAPTSGGTILNVIASAADSITPDHYPDAAIIDILVRELRHYVQFDLADILHCRTHLQTNVGEELFVNQVGSWQWRPETTCGIPNLFIAGDYCRTFVDVVTIEGAVVSGLMAAEAVCRRRRVGPAVVIRQPDRYPVLPLAMFAAGQRPFAYLAYAASSADSAVKRLYSALFPNG